MFSAELWACALVRASDECYMAVLSGSSEAFAASFILHIDMATTVYDGELQWGLSLFGVCSQGVVFVSRVYVRVVDDVYNVGGYGARSVGLVILDLYIWYERVLRLVLRCVVMWHRVNAGVVRRRAHVARGGSADSAVATCCIGCLDVCTELSADYN